MHVFELLKNNFWFKTYSFLSKKKKNIEYIVTFFPIIYQTVSTESLSENSNILKFLMQMYKSDSK